MDRLQVEPGVRPAQGLDAERLLSVAGERAVDLVRHRRVRPGGGELPGEGLVVELQAHHHVSRALAGSGFEGKGEVLDREAAAGGTPGDRVRQEPRHVVGRVEALRRVGRQDPHALPRRRLGDLLEELHERPVVAPEEGSVQLPVLDPPEHGPGTRPRRRQKPAGRLGARLLPAAGAVGEHVHERPLALDPPVDAELVAGVGDEERDAHPLRPAPSRTDAAATRRAPSPPPGSGPRSRPCSAGARRRPPPPSAGPPARGRPGCPPR